MYSDHENIRRCVQAADMVIGAVLIAGARAPTLVSGDLVAEMEPGSVVVDVAVDQGGCIETCRPTTHDDPSYIEHGVVHYCVANMPGAVAQTSTFALSAVTLPYALSLVQQGIREACGNDPELAKGLNTLDGDCTHAAVAHSLDLPYVAPRI